MKKLRIFPGAAGVIALTAAIGFIDGQREMENEDLARDKFIVSSAHTDDVAPGSRLAIKPDRPAYLVDIKRGERSSGILIDATTGRVLLS